MNIFQEEKSGGKPRLMRSDELPSWIIKDDAEVIEIPIPRRWMPQVFSPNVEPLKYLQSIIQNMFICAAKLIL